MMKTSVMKLVCEVWCITYLLTRQHVLSGVGKPSLGTKQLIPRIVYELMEYKGKVGGKEELCSPGTGEEE